MKLNTSQKFMLDHIAAYGTPRGMKLGRGRPNDLRVLKQLVDGHHIKMTSRSAKDPLQADYAVRGPEDKHGLALFVDIYGTVWGAVHYGVLVRPFDESDYHSDLEGSAMQNGEDTAWECYPNDPVRREWMAWAIARSSLEMND